MWSTETEIEAIETNLNKEEVLCNSRQEKQFKSLTLGLFFGGGFLMASRFVHVVGICIRDLYAVD